MNQEQTLITMHEHGEMHISEYVIASIAAHAANEVEGVAGMATRADWRGKKSLRKGVRVLIDGTNVVCDIFLTVKRNQPIIKISEAVQEKVKVHIEAMTGLQAAEINVHVVGVAYNKTA